ncbi:N-methylproline demethylase [Falsochrobactrum shanghaiense]|uniref:N-methylproline demethylase n=1 Tax=Falsochrobactrum shanghaiense TaxID=2201899 RepID=A0A316JAQ8_9HYPH|nr:NADH:flavin oxidoreductase [Falsochrobactrum shanghaiense]PWL18331.1 N-methylproline demethylase [Falsochrobactrum shanghaiense]
MNMSQDPLLQPFQLKNLTLRNRIVSTSHEPAYGEQGMPKDRYRLYHVEKAKGGVGLTMIGTSMVSRDSPSSFGSNLVLHRPEIEGWLRKVADDVHAEGAALMLQITHLGRRTSHYAGDWLPALSASAIPEPFHRATPKIAEDWDLERIIADYAAAALRCREAGLDGIEIECYGHLFDGFLSPLTNKRTDRWGGSAEKRLAFPRAVVQAIRKAVGPDFIVGLRAAIDEDDPEGVGLEEGLNAVRVLASDGIDFLSVIKGTIGTDEGLARVIPPMGTPSAPFLDFAGKVKKALDLPIMHAARINDVATARHAVGEGLLDLVGMTRAMMADPHIVNKVATGLADRIRPCVGATYCLDALHRTGDSKCIHNPSTGREGVLPHIIPRSATPGRRAVVVGGGPAGLEAARVLAERGHKVTLFEANKQPGGQIVIAAKSKRRRDLIGIVDWRLAEAEILGVDIHCGVYAEVDDVLAERPDIVIVATGGLPDRSFLKQGEDLVADTWEVMTDRPKSGDVLVFDNMGGHAGLDATETLVNGGAKVEYVTPARVIAPEVGPLTSPGYLRMFADHGVQVSLGWRLHGVTREGGRLAAHLVNEYSQSARTRIVDHVVVEHGTLPNDDLYFGLIPYSVNLGELDLQAFIDIKPQGLRRNENGRFQLFRIGDAVAGRNIHAAIYDAARLCMPA